MLLHRFLIPRYFSNYRNYSDHGGFHPKNVPPTKNNHSEKPKTRFSQNPIRLDDPDRLDRYRQNAGHIRRSLTPKLYKKDRQQSFDEILDIEFGGGRDQGLDKYSQRPSLASLPSVQDYMDKQEWRREKARDLDMARRKYYDFPVEDNLLTWRAKEQIFELRAQNPEVWTIEKICQSFPISQEALRRLLKKKSLPINFSSDEEKLKEIEKHDELVKQRWILLKRGRISAEDSDDDLLSEITLRMIRTGQVKFLPMYAAGNEKILSINTDEEKIQKIPDGPFGKLYQRHLNYLNSNLNLNSNSKSTDEKENSGEKKNNDDVELLRKYVFPEDCENVNEVPMPFDNFRKELDRSLARSDRSADKLYREWMQKKIASSSSDNSR